MKEKDRYITLAPAVKFGKMCVTVVEETADDNYLVTRCSEPMNEQAARALAYSWAAAMKLEIR